MGDFRKTDAFTQAYESVIESDFAIRFMPGPLLLAAVAKYGVTERDIRQLHHYVTAAQSMFALPTGGATEVEMSNNQFFYVKNNEDRKNNKEFTLTMSLVVKSRTASVKTLGLDSTVWNTLSALNKVKWDPAIGFGELKQIYADLKIYAIEFIDNPIHWTDIRLAHNCFFASLPEKDKAFNSTTAGTIDLTVYTDLLEPLQVPLPVTADFFL